MLPKINHFKESYIKNLRKITSGGGGGHNLYQSKMGVKLKNGVKIFRVGKAGSWHQKYWQILMKIRKERKKTNNRANSIHRKDRTVCTEIVCFSNFFSNALRDGHHVSLRKITLTSEFILFKDPFLILFFFEIPCWAPWDFPTSTPCSISEMLKLSNDFCWIFNNSWVHLFTIFPMHWRITFVDANVEPTKRSEFQESLFLLQFDLTFTVATTWWN